MSQYTIRIPGTPHTILRPNVTSLTTKQREQFPWPLKVKHASVVKNAVRQELRIASGWASKQLAPDTPISGPVMLHYRVVWEKGRQIADFDAVVTMLKGATDGLMDGGWIVDDRQVVGMTVVQERSKEPVGYIEVWVEVIEDERQAA